MRRQPSTVQVAFEIVSVRGCFLAVATYGLTSVLHSYLAALFAGYRGYCLLYVPASRLLTLIFDWKHALDRHSREIRYSLRPTKFFFFGIRVDVWQHS